MKGGLEARGGGLLWGKSNDLFQATVCLRAGRVARQRVALLTVASGPAAKM